MQINENVLNNEEKIAYVLRSLYRRFGYSQYKMSKFEEYALYVRNKDYLVSDGIISFTDTNGRLLALKPDVTLSIINNSKDNSDEVEKLYYDENVYRISKSSRSFKEIKQTGLECIGKVEKNDVCEVIMLAIRSLMSISENYIFEISHAGLLESVLDELGLVEEIRKKISLCINQKNSDELRSLCESDDLYEKLSVFMKHYSSFDCALGALREVCTDSCSAAQLEEFAFVLDFIKKMGLDKNTRVDFSLANDMKYYSGVAFKGYVEGIPTSVLSGGQYDKLMKKMRKNASAIGFAVYLDSLQRYNAPDKEYDVDVIIIGCDDPSKNVRLADKLFGEGKSAMICASIPENVRYREVAYADEKEVN